MNEFHVNTIINNMLKVEKIEEAFNCFLGEHAFANVDPGTVYL